MRLFSCFFPAILTYFSAVISLQAQNVSLIGNIEAVSTECSGGTKVFSIYGNGSVFSKLYIFKDNKLILSNEMYDDIQQGWSIYCLSHAIIITGTHGSEYRTSAITTDGNKLKLTRIAEHRVPARLRESDSQTIIDIYGDDREGLDTTIVHQVMFNEKFSVSPDEMSTPSLTVRPSYFSEAISEHTTLTTLSKCYNPVAENNYTVAAYTIDDIPGVELVGSSHSLENAGLSFIATNSMCIRGDTYLFGKKDGELRSARISYNEKTKKFRFEAVPLSETPLQPSIE